MNTYETSATVGEQGQVRVADVPFAPGTEVQITIIAKRPSAEDFTTAWRQLCVKMRGLPRPEEITDEDIDAEIDGYRGGR